MIFLQTATGHECPGLGLPRKCGGKIQLLESSEFGGNKLGVHQPKMVIFLDLIRNWPFCDLKAAGSRRDLVSEWNLKALEPDEGRSPGLLLNCHRGCIIFGPKNTWNKAFLLKADMGWSENHD